MELMYKVVIGLDDYIFDKVECAEKFAKLAMFGDKERNRITITVLRREEKPEHEEE